MARCADVMTREPVCGEPADSIVISHSTWQNYFASDPNILGSSITVANSQHTVIGVTRPGFSFPAGAESWEAFDAGPALTDRINFQGYLRLRPNATPESLESELDALSARLGPNTETGKPFVYVLRPLLDEVVGDLSSTVLLLSAATIILLLIACVNVANLLLSRASGRSHEIALREALGAGRFRIVRQLMTESLLLCIVGGTVGVALAYSGERLLLGHRSRRPAAPWLSEYRRNGSAVFRRRRAVHHIPGRPRSRLQVEPVAVASTRRRWWTWRFTEPDREPRVHGPGHR